MRHEDLATPIHASLIRPVLLAGAERELVLVNVILIVVLVLGVGPHPLTFLLAVLMGTLGHTALVFAARFDPQMWKVYARHVTYQPFYPARARFDAPAPPVHPFNRRPQ